MDKHIDNLLDQLGNDTPIINPKLASKIYSKALEKKHNNISFFSKPLTASLMSFAVMIFVFIILVSFNPFSNSNNSDDKPGNTGDSNSSVYVPILSSSSVKTMFMDLHYAIKSTNYDVITIAVDNKIDYQKIYLKSYQYEILSVQLNNGDCLINEVYFDNELFYEVIFENYNLNVHYFDICFAKGTFNKLASNALINFTMYVDKIDINKGYGCEFKINKVYDLSGVIH